MIQRRQYVDGRGVLVFMGDLEQREIDYSYGRSEVDGAWGMGRFVNTTAQLLGAEVKVIYVSTWDSIAPPILAPSCKCTWSFY